MKNNKFCIDCKWSRFDVKDSDSLARCYNPKSLKLNLVNGKIKDNNNNIDYCDHLREIPTFLSYFPPFSCCGKSGRWFESK